MHLGKEKSDNNNDVMIKKRQWGHMVRDAASEWTNGWLGHGQLVASWWDEAAGRVAVSAVSCCVELCYVVALRVSVSWPSTLTASPPASTTGCPTCCPSREAWSLWVDPASSHNAFVCARVCVHLSVCRRHLLVVNAPCPCRPTTTTLCWLLETQRGATLRGVRSWAGSPTTSTWSTTW